MSNNSRRNTKEFLVARQDGRCAVCTTTIHAEVARRRLFRREDGSSDAGVLPIDPQLPRDKANGYAACDKCVGAWDRSMTLTELRESVLTPRPKKGKLATEYPETLELIRTAVAKEVDEPIHIPIDYRFAAPDNAERIAQSLIYKYRNRLEGRYPQFASVGPRSVSRAMRKRLLAEQNYRCCYDGVVMNLEPLDGERKGGSTLRLATVEHILDLSLGGTNEYENLAMACKICNNYRSTIKMTAEEFHAFIVENPTFIENRIEDIVSGLNKKRRKERKSQRRKEKLWAV